VGRGRPSCSGGVEPVGPDRIRFDLTIDGKRIRPTKPWIPTEKNLREAREYRAYLKRCIAEGRFRLAEEFPEYACQHGERVPATTKSCADVFEGFLRHQETRVIRGEITQGTFDRHRQIINRVWRPHVDHWLLTKIAASTLQEVADQQCLSPKAYNDALGVASKAFDFGLRDFPGCPNPVTLIRRAKLKKRPIDPFSVHDAEKHIAALHEEWGEGQGNFDELRFFTGLRPCEDIALRVDDYDRVNRRLNINKTRVRGYERYQTKNKHDRSVKLCRRAIDVIERQLKLRSEMVARGLISHDSLFFTGAGAPIRNLWVTGRRWKRTLTQLPIRYRRPYVARHTSVSWNLMIGKKPQHVAKQHGHSGRTMWAKYAAWVEGAEPGECNVIRRARRCAPARGHASEPG